MIKILVVDDHPLVGDGISTMLKDELHLNVCGICKNGKQAIESFTESEPDVILLDISLPDIDGIELCSIIRKQNKEVKIIGLTSTNEAGIISQFLAKGGNGYLLKDMERYELLEAIDEVMNHDALIDIDLALRELLQHSEPWLAKAAQAYAHGSPTSAALSFELMKRHEGTDLADVLRLEYQASVGCCAHNDFPEGVRALLVDKDKSPKWCPAKVDEVSADQIADILKPRFSELHPLHDLGKSN